MTLCLLFASPGVLATPDFADLAATPRWQALLHINHAATLRDIGASFVDDQDFFLAANGKQTPVAELRATWRALKPAHARARCDFPARYRFLAEHLGWHQPQPLAHCEQYLAWRKTMPTGQMVLVFPASYLNSPSSMFGHTLLRLDPRKHVDTSWLSRAISFGADVETIDNTVFYAWRGIVTGYPGSFTVGSYFQEIRKYAFLENRDMWEYTLNLTSDELDWIVRHLWELKGINFNYYFFDENCSFRLLDLIRVGRPSLELLDKFRFAELPVHTVRALDGAGLITARDYIPSKARQLQRLAAQLGEDELEMAEALTTNPALATSRRFLSHPPKRRNLIARVAYSALRFHSRHGPRDKAIARAGFELLQVIQNTPAATVPPAPVPAPPESGHGTQMLSAGGGARAGLGFVSLGYRLTYHDVLDPAAGFLRGAGIQGLGVYLRLNERDDLVLERLDVVNIRSLAPRSTFLHPISWFVHGGLGQARAEDQNDRNLTLFIQGGPGLSWSWGDAIPYVFSVGRLETVSGAEPGVIAGGGAELGLVYYAPGAQLGFSVRGLYLSSGFYRHRAQASANIPISDGYAVRTVCTRQAWDGGDEIGCRLSLRHYFD